MFSLPLLLVFSLSAACIEIDIVVPSFPDMQVFFNANVQQIQSTLSVNFLGFCLSAIFYGPLSECFGRKKLMLAGNFLFMLGAIGCFIAQDINFLILARFIQGVGASSSVVIAFAMIADVYKEDESAKYIGRINALLTALMAIAPVLGGFINQIFYWRANFLFIALVSVLSNLLLWLYLPETKNKSTFKKFSVNTLLSGYIRLIKSRKFLLYALVPNVIVAAYLTYVGCAAFYYMKTCNFSTIEFAINQAVVVATFSVFSFYANNIINMLGNLQCKIGGIILCIIGSLLILWCTFFAPLKPLFITVGMVIFSSGAAVVFAIVFAKSLEIFPDLIGDASAFIQSTRLLCSFIAVEIAGYFYDGTFKSTAWTIFICLVIGMVAMVVILLEEYKISMSSNEEIAIEK